MFANPSPGLKALAWITFILAASILFAVSASCGACIIKSVMP